MSLHSSPHCTNIFHSILNFSLNFRATPSSRINMQFIDLESFKLISPLSLKNPCSKINCSLNLSDRFYSKYIKAHYLPVFELEIQPLVRSSISSLKLEETCVNQGLFERYVPGLSELLHTSCSTMATASTRRRRLSHISSSQCRTMGSDKGQRDGFAKDMIGSICEGPLSLFLFPFLYQGRRNRSIGTLRRLQARFSTIVVFSSDTHELVSRHGFRDGTGGASGTGRRK